MKNISRSIAAPLGLLLCSVGVLLAEDPPPSPEPAPPVALPDIPTPELPPLPDEGTWHVPKGTTHQGRAVKMGQAVSVDGTLDGSLWAIAKETRVAGKVTGGLQSTGERVVITGEVGDDARLLVGEARVDGIVRGDLTFAGGKLTIGPKARIEGDVDLTGQEIEVLGTIAGETKIAGGVLRLSGRLEDDARIEVDELVVDPGARIAGDLKYSARKSTDLEGTGVVLGRIERDGRMVAHPPTVTEHPLPLRSSAERSQEREEDDDGTGVGFLLGMYAFLLAVGCGVLAAGRRLVPQLVGYLREEPLQCIGVGFLAWLSPFAVAFTVILIVTIPLIVAYWLLFLALVPFTFVPVAAWIGDALFRKLGRASVSRYGQFAAGLAIWWLVLQIPVLGVIAAAATFLAGPGTVVIALRNWWVNRKRKTTPPAPTAAVPAAV